MAALGSANPIYSKFINNFHGELFRVGGQRTPFTAAVGGMTGGGKVIQSTFFQFQTADSATVSGAADVGTEGGAPTEYLGRDRVAYNQVTQIFHKGVKMSYTALATYNQQNVFNLSNASYNESDGDGTTSASSRLALFGGNPITDEFAEQMELALDKIAKEVEYFAINGTYNDGTAADFAGTNDRQFRGLDAHLALTGGNIYYNTDDELSTGTDQKIHWDGIAGALKVMYDSSAPMKQPVLLVSSANLLELNKQLASPTVSGALTGTILPRDRNVGGIDVDTIITPFGSIGMMVLDSNVLGNTAAYIVDLAYVSPVFTNIPGKGTVFVRDIDQSDNARVAKAIYMEMGFDFGPPQYHLKISDIAAP
jgi:hypothetical protein